MELWAKGSLSPSDVWDIGTLVLLGFGALFSVLMGASFASMGIVPTRASTLGLAFSWTHWANRSFGLMPLWADSMIRTLKVFGSKSILGLWAFVIMSHWYKRYLSELVQWDIMMSIMDAAKANRGGRASSEDAILKPCIAILILEEKLKERFDAIKELTVVGIDEETGLPKVYDYASETDQAKAEQLQQEIAGLNRQKAELTALITEIEAVFASYDRNPMPMEGIDNRLLALQEAPLNLARRLNNLIVQRIRADPTIHFAKLFTDPDVLEMETARTRAIAEGLTEQATLEKLKNEINSICISGEPLYRKVKYAYREDTSNPATVALMQGNEQDLDEEAELDRMESAL
jgi:hypothetical protein